MQCYLSLHVACGPALGWSGPTAPYTQQQAWQWDRWELDWTGTRPGGTVGQWPSLSCHLSLPHPSPSLSLPSPYPLLSPSLTCLSSFYPHPSPCLSLPLPPPSPTCLYTCHTATILLHFEHACLVLPCLYLPLWMGCALPRLAAFCACAFIYALPAAQRARRVVRVAFIVLLRTCRTLRFLRSPRARRTAAPRAATLRMPALPLLPTCVTFRMSTWKNINKRTLLSSCAARRALGSRNHYAPWACTGYARRRRDAREHARWWGARAGSGAVQHPRTAVPSPTLTHKQVAQNLRAASGRSDKYENRQYLSLSCGVIIAAAGTIYYGGRKGLGTFSWRPWPPALRFWTSSSYFSLY